METESAVLPWSLQRAVLPGCAGNTYPSLSVICGDELTFMWPAGTPHGVALIPSSASLNTLSSCIICVVTAPPLLWLLCDW